MEHKWQFLQALPVTDICNIKKTVSSFWNFVSKLVTFKYKKGSYKYYGL